MNDTNIATLNMFCLTILQQKNSKNNYLFPVFSSDFTHQQQALNYICDYLQQNFKGFVIFKNNIYPQDNLNELNPYLNTNPPTNSIFIINQIANSFQYEEILQLSQQNTVIAGFECFSSAPNHYYDFMSKFTRLTKLITPELNKYIHSSLFCEQNNLTFDTNYTFFNKNFI